MLAWARVSWDLLPETLCRPGALTEARLGPSAWETAFQLWGHLFFPGRSGALGPWLPPPSGPMAPAGAYPVNQPRPGCCTRERSSLASSCPWQGC